MNMKKLKFSVVIPLYNKGPHISRAIRSVLSQTLQDFELIVVNDASTDNSIKEIKKFNDIRIRLLHRTQPGPGGYAARNLGTSEARSEWIAFLDADDEWDPQYLSEIELLKKKFKTAGCLCTGYKYTHPNGQFSVNEYTKHFSTRGPHLIDLKKFLLATASALPPIHTSAVVIKKELLDKVGGFPENRCRRGGDIDTWLRIMLQTEAAWSPLIGATYYRDSVNMVTRTVPNTNIQCVYSTIKETLRNKEYKEYKRALKKFSNHYSANTILSAAKSGKLNIELIKCYFGSVNPGFFLFSIFLWMLPKRLLYWSTKLGNIFPVTSNTKK
ncbi:glycosyltransferase family 2 protein [Desulfolucanica intricata]|uniref:glycosyltransferase family 2 protein n=1 Tax=Desulfolucanica intricata TaxID=1285191 RepID=UPI000832F3F5|nr:glycosyltransferase family A protein [Desulfolucanica intricata]